MPHPLPRPASLVLCALLSACAAAPAALAPAPPPHPLDPLGADEIRAAVELIRKERHLAPEVRFAEVELKEPAKDSLAAGHAAPAREVRAVLYDRAAHRTFEAQVDLSAGKVVRFEAVPGAQPMMMNGEFEAVPELVLADPQVKAALAKRGIADPKQVQVDVWAPGPRPAPEIAPGTRFCRCLFFFMGTGTLGYGRPVEGLLATVDLDARKLVKLTDTGAVPLAPEAHDFFDPAQRGAPRAALKPLHTIQIAGPSFTLRGHEVAWDAWRFRFANTAREGLVLHQVGLVDQGKLRSVLHRASLSEICVPYGDPDDTWNWRAACDEGEYGLGQLSNTLERGKTAPAHATLLDTVLADDAGEPAVKPASVMLYERDAGLLWSKKDDYQTRRIEARRGRELVLAQIVTVGNYDYELQWIFSQDGSLRAEVALTGMLLAKGVGAERCQRCDTLLQGRAEPERDDRHGTVVARNVVAPNHQHFFCYRLDFDVDGRKNSVGEMNVRAAPQDAQKPDQASDNAFLMEETVLGSEAVAARDARPMSHRAWRIFNPTQRNPLGHFPGFVLEPEHGASAFLADESPVRAHAGFLAHSLWVTRQHDAERYAAGEWPNQGHAGEGLPAFAADHEPLDGQDLVVWHTFGLTHLPRPEEWPVMGATRAGFKIAPKGFFQRNPALDLP